MFFIGLGTATPKRRYSQTECWNTLQNSPEYHLLEPRARAIARKVLLGNNGVVARHLCLDSLQDAFTLSPDALHARFAKNAPALAATAAERALQQAGRRPDEVDGLIISTCTGYLCPGLTSYVSELLGLRSGIVALDLVGQGCGAAIPNLRAAEALLQSGQCQTTLSICVEICSAALYLDNDPGVLISACLFGDGAAAALCSLAPDSPNRRVQWKGARSVLNPAHRDLLRFEHRHGMLRNILTLQVPELAGRHAARLCDETLAAMQLSRDQISQWILHSGGRDILLAMQEHFQLGAEELRWSAEVLKHHGNISSPCVLFVLQEALAANAPGGNWWMSAFGAGFSCHGAVLEVEPLPHAPPAPNSASHGNTA